MEQVDLSRAIKVAQIKLIYGLVCGFLVGIVLGIQIGYIIGIK